MSVGPESVPMSVTTDIHTNPATATNKAVVSVPTTSFHIGGGDYLTLVGLGGPT